MDERSTMSRFVPLVQAMLLVNAVIGLTVPVWWGAITAARGYDLVTFGTMQTINTAASCVVGTFFVFSLQHFNRRLLLMALGGVMALAELATIVAIDQNAFFAVRALSNTAMGMIDVLGVVYLSYTREPSKIFGWYVTLQTIVQSASLFFLPQIAKAFGVTGMQMAMASIGVIVALIALCLPAATPRIARVSDGKAPPIPWLVAIPVLLAFQMFGFFTSDYFAYSERFGDARGIDLDRVSLILTITMAAGLPASLFVSWLGDRLGRIAPVLFGSAAGFISCLLLLAPQWGELGYWVGLTVFSLVWSFVYPFLLSLVTAIDPVGRLMVATSPVRGAMSAASQAALTVATAHYGLAAAAWFAATAVVLCPLFAILAMRLQAQRLRQTAPA